MVGGAHGKNGAGVLSLVVVEKRRDVDAVTILNRRMEDETAPETTSSVFHATLILVLTVTQPLLVTVYRYWNALICS